jgi:WbqC-like protein family
MIKKVAIMQPYFLPYIGYFQLINAVDEFILYDDVNFINKGWINRNNILINNASSLFSIPLKEASQNKLINEIEILQDEKWKSKLLKTIEQSYKKAPFYTNVFPLISQIIQFEEINCAKYIQNSLSSICKYLHINTLITESTSIFNNATLKGQHRILDICKQTKATQYINPIGGQELYQKNIFDNNQIQLNFLKTNTIQYKQFSTNFIPYLSILDLLMFNNSEEINVYLNEFELI